MTTIWNISNCNTTIRSYLPTIGFIYSNMVLPFDKQPAIHKRYEFYSPSSDVGEIKAEEYVNFLKNMASADQNDAIEFQPQTSFKSVKAKVDTGLGGQSAARLKDVSPLAKGHGVLAVTEIASENKKELEKKMKIIQDNMLQKKQEERKLKRIEGDIVKKQRLLRRVMHDYDNDIFGKKKVEEMKLRGSIKQIEDAKQQHLMNELSESKSKSQKNVSDMLENKQSSRKDLLMKNDFEYQYQKAARELELKRNEVESLTKEYKQKIKLKELEEYSLTKRLAELAIATTMEDHKQRATNMNYEMMTKHSHIIQSQEALSRQKALETRLYLGKSHERKFEGNKRKLSQDRIETNDKMSLKIREEGRKMTDINRSLQNNSTAQRDTQIYADYLDRKEKGKNVDLRQKMAEAKRTTMLEQLSNERKMRNAQRMARTQDRFFETGIDSQKISYSDSIRHLQKGVSKQEEMEHALYNQVRSSEASYRKQEQQCEHLQEDLSALQRENMKQLKEFQVECKSKETALKQTLLREQAELQKARTNKEEGIQSLVKLREVLREEKHRLNEDEKEHHRLARLEHTAILQEIAS